MDRWSTGEFVERIGSAAGAAPEAEAAWADVKALGWTLPAHRSVAGPLDRHMVAVVLGRGAEVRCAPEGGRAIEASCGRGSLGLVPAGTPVDWDVGGDLHVLNLFLPPALLEAAADAAGGRVPDAPFLARRDREAATLGAMIAGALGRRTTGGEAYASALVTALAARLVTDAAAHGPARAAAKLSPAQRRRAIAFMDAHLGEPITLQEIAAAAGLSEFHFARGFRASTGEAPHAYLTRLRVERARTLIAASDVPLAEVAVECGFGSASSLAHVVRRLLGVTPSSLRAGDLSRE